MAIIRRVTRIANPRRKIRRVRRAKAVTRRRHNAARRKRGAPVIRRYSVKTLKKELRRRGVKANPSARRRKVRRAIKRRNPVLLEFGALNPHRKRRKSVARKHRRSRNTRRRRAVARVTRRRRRRNPVVTVHNRRRRYGRRRNRVHHYSRRRRRNPMGFSTKGLVEQSVGVLAGVSAVRVLPAMIPANLTGMLPTTAFTGAAINAAVTFGAYMIASKFGPPDFARGVALGGSAIVVSQLWTAMGLPAPQGFGLSGVGDIVPTMGFTVPDRSMRAVPMVPAAALSGFARGRRGGR